MNDHPEPTPADDTDGRLEESIRDWLGSSSPRVFEAIGTPGPPILEKRLPVVTAQPYPLYVTLQGGGVTAVDALVLAWQYPGNQTLILIAGVNGPEWIDPTVWDRVRFATAPTPPRLPPAPAAKPPF